MKLSASLPASSLLAALVSCASPSQTAPVASPPAPRVAAAAHEAPPTDPIADECRGAEVDLIAAAGSGRCDVGGTADPLPPSVEVELAATDLRAAAGELTPAALILANRGLGPALFELDASCRFANAARVSIFDHRGKRIDDVGLAQCVEQKRSCAGHVIQVELAPDGRAEIPFEVNTRLAAVDHGSCEALPGRALVPGRYRVLVSTPLAAAPFEAHLVVTALERLPRSRCRSYARRLARLAEPDAARRPEVAAQVDAQCRRAPPPRALVDCQLGAATEAELAACAESARR